MNANSEIVDYRYPINELCSALCDISDGVILFEDSIQGSPRYAFKNKESASRYIRQRMDEINGFAILDLNEKESYVESFQEEKIKIQLSYTHHLMDEAAIMEPVTVRMYLAGHQIKRAIII